MTATALAKSAHESDCRDLLAVIHAYIPSGVGFTVEHPAIREWIDARQLTGTNRVGALFKALASTGHMHRIDYQRATRAEAAYRVIAVWEHEIGGGGVGLVQD